MFLSLPIILTSFPRKIFIIKIDFHTHSIYLHLLQHYESRKPRTKFYANCGIFQEFEIMWKHAVFEFAEHLELLLWLLMIAKNKIGFMVSVWEVGVSMGAVFYWNCGGLSAVCIQRFKVQSIWDIRLVCDGSMIKIFGAVCHFFDNLAKTYNVS